MKRMTLLAAAASSCLALSCTPDVLSIQVRNAIGGQPDESCSVKDEKKSLKSGGAVDLDYTSSYWVALWLTSALDNSAVTAGGGTVNPPSRNDFYISEVSLKYSGDGVPPIPEQIRPKAGTLSPQGDLFVSVNLLTSEAAERLRAAMAPWSAVAAKVAIVFRGKFAHGASYETAPFEFPLTVWRTEPAVECPSNMMPVAIPPANLVPACGNWGQDGIYYACGCRSDCGGCTAGTTCNVESCSCEAK